MPIATLLLSSLLAAANSAATNVPASGDIDRFVASSETCFHWRRDNKNASTAAIEAAIHDACAALPQRLTELRTAHAADTAAVQRLSAYDARSGESLAPWPKDIVALGDRLEHCGFLGGEFGGDGSTEDAQTTGKMVKLRCGDPLTKDLSTLRRHYQNDARVSARLRMYDKDGTPIPLIPEDLNTYEAQSASCAEPHVKSPACTQLPARLSKLLAKYRNPNTQYPEHCVWDELHCYDSTTGLPVQISERWDASMTHVLKDASGKPLINITPRAPSAAEE
ncbi:hypothetical protein [Dyella silvatica]|uniref:hypothetical protein n=1 Tax=Dyella silvatica TaxID=2992128 RepID=UPI00225491C2|nr:hypothetical protein [Dyella silvatica]